MNLNEPKKERSVLWETAPGIVISVVLVGFLVWIVDWESLVRASAAVPPSLAAALFALQTIAFMLRAAAWRIALDMRPSWAQCFWTISEGYLLNLMPLRLGEVGRAVIMGGLIGRNPVSVFSTIVLERLFDLLVTAVFLIVSVPLVSGAAISPVFYLVLVGLIAGGLVLLFALLRNQARFFAWLGRFLKPESKVGRALTGILRSVFRGLEVLAEPRKFFAWLFWILATWVFWFGSMYAALMGFFPELPVWSTFFIQGFSAFGGAIPSAPAGIGVIEGATVFALGLFDIETSPALAFALFNHSIAILTPIVLGLIGFIVQGQRFSLIFRRLRETRLSGEEEDSGEQ